MYYFCSPTTRTLPAARCPHLTINATPPIPLRHRSLCIAPYNQHHAVAQPNKLFNSADIVRGSPLLDINLLPPYFYRAAPYIPSRLHSPSGTPRRIPPPSIPPPRAFQPRTDRRNSLQPAKSVTGWAFLREAGCP